MDNILASCIKNNEHLAAFDKMVESRLYSLDLSALIPNLFDIVPADALPYLAMQWGVSGYNGWRYADTEQKQRDLLKRAIAINKLKGTEYAIKEALKMIGMTPVTIVKGQYYLYCNGEQFANGGFKCGVANPFVIQVQVSQSDFPTITPQLAIDMLAIISTFKAARDHLVSIDFFTDPATESFSFGGALTFEVDNGINKTTYSL